MIKKILSSTLAVLFLLGSLAACSGPTAATTAAQTMAETMGQAAGETQPAGEGGGGSAGASNLPPVTLKMYFIGEPGPDNDLVFEKISDILEEKINARLEPKFLSWGDYLQRYPLLFSSGEDFDMIYTASWSFYSETASKGGFYELTPELLKEYAPMVMENLPQNAWDTTKVNGKNYMIPHFNYWANHYGIIIRGDLRKKYGLDEIKTVEDLEVYMDKVLENEPGMIPVSTNRNEVEMIMRTLVLYRRVFTI